MMHEEKPKTQKSVYLSPDPGLFGCAASDSVASHSVRMCVACKSCSRQKQETDQRLVEEKNKEKKCPPPGFIFDR